MTPAPTPFRRSLAVLAALAVLLAPTAELAHAEVMLHTAAATCSPAAGHRPMAPMPESHGSHHQHGSRCCDLCPAGCQTVAVTPAVAGLSAITVTRTFGPATLRHDPALRRSAHLLPFSLAPPLRSA